MAYTVANAAFTTLTSELGPSDLTLNVASTTAFPATPFIVTLLPASGTASYEFIIIDSNKTATTLVASATSKRYQNGSSAGSGLTWPVGTRVRHDVDELLLEELRTDVDAKVAKSLVTTAGDILYATASAVLARLGIGTARQVLATNAGGTAPEWVASLQSLMTAQGDIVYASAANTPARLAKGTAAQVLTMNAGATAPEWAAAGTAFVGARAYRSAALSIAHNTNTDVGFDAETFDSDAFHDNATNNTRLTVPSGKDGKYLIQAQIGWANNTTGTRQIDIYKNGATRIASVISDAASNTVRMVAVTVAALVATDYITVQVYQSSGGSLALETGDDITHATISRVGT